GQRAVVRNAAVRTPVPLVLAAVTVEDDDAAVAVTIPHEHLARLHIHVDVRRPSQASRVIAAALTLPATDNQQQLPFRAVLGDEIVLRPVAGQPDEAFAVDEDAMLVAGPLLRYVPALTLNVPHGATPGAQQCALTVELQHGRCRHAALGERRRLYGAGLRGTDRARPLYDPHRVVGADGKARNLADDPVIRQVAGPGGIDLVNGGLRQRGRGAKQQQPQHGGTRFTHSGTNVPHHSLLLW